MQGLRHQRTEPILDPGWIHLMMAAKQIGIPIEEVRQFLRERSIDENEDEP
jgi:DNA-binding transcriptional MerR regulator